MHGLRASIPNLAGNLIKLTRFLFRVTTLLSTNRSQVSPVIKRAAKL